MFDKMKQMKELTGLLANAGELQRRVQEAQDKLGEQTTGGQAGANAVQVGINGKLEILNIKIDQKAVSKLANGGDANAMLEQLVVAATNDALGNARALIQETMSEVTGGMNLPGLDGFGF